ncbi:hypothetical protein RF11_11982 [Thelohanellus kitauei]|uniref:Uncharacterized protein n=1 Tax=Thelohanellus kitauei TaxID=669202 RepID=A0A0C2MP92_THEKT|nr:hypothetical protein RF11_11982 [Thelohanellus kitauei]
MNHLSHERQQLINNLEIIKAHEKQMKISLQVHGHLNNHVSYLEENKLNRACEEILEIAKIFTENDFQGIEILKDEYAEKRLNFIGYLNKCWVDSFEFICNENPKGLTKDFSCFKFYNNLPFNLIEVIDCMQKLGIFRDTIITFCKIFVR